MSRFACSLAVVLCLLNGPLAAEDKPAPDQSPSPTAFQAPAYDPALCLGLTPEGAYRLLGAPAEIYPVKVADDLWQVIHYYPTYQYFFWFSNRVWQVRLDKRYKDDFGGGLHMGMTQADCEAKLGPSLGKGDVWEIWQLPFRAFPRRLRLVFENGKLTDAYFYRSDI